jgi:hypothetical protein
VSNSSLRPCRALLVILAILCLGRVVFLAQRYARASLQTDFSAMYFAGASVRAGLDPYDNNAARDPQLKYWDGAARYRHSRYLYPPIVAYALQPLAGMAYPAAKFLWTFASLAVLAAAVVLAIKAAGVRLDATRWLLAVVVISIIFPLQPLLERGQIDAVTLLLVALGFYLTFARRRDFLGGATIAAAGFIKLQCFYLLPLLLMARRTRAAMGMMIGIVVMGIVQILVCGPGLTRQYVVEELPRIARHGEVGSETMRLDSPAMRDINARLPAGDAVAGGRWQFRYTLLREYAAMASLVPYVRGVINNVAGVRVPGTAVSIPLLLLALATMSFFLRRGVADDPWARLAFIGAALIIVLLTAPITWTSNLVWLAPLVPLILFGPTPAGARFVRSAALVGLGLLILPDTLAPGLLVRLGRLGEVLGAQYVVAQLLILPYTLTIAAAAGPAPAKS